MTKITTEYIRWLEAERKRINALDLDEIEFTERGEVLDISPEVIEDFEFAGLSNCDFILMGYYKEEPK